MPSTPPDYLSLAEGLERIYQIVVGLSITEAVKRFIRETKPPTPLPSPDKTDIYFSPHKESIPEAIAFFATVVPFFHGMNRYIELTYGQGKPPSIILLADIFAFLAEGCIMFMLASSLTARNLRFFRVMIALLALDGIWCLFSYQYGEFSTGLGWFKQNLVVGVALFALTRAPSKWEMAKKILCMLAVVGKTSFDYYQYWDSFYFPA